MSSILAEYNWEVCNLLLLKLKLGLPLCPIGVASVFFFNLLGIYTNGLILNYINFEIISRPIRKFC